MDFYWNFYALGYFLHGIFTTSLFVMLLGMKQKSTNTKIVLSALFTASLLCFAYTYSYGSLERNSIFHRWITFPVANLQPILVTALFLKFPNDKSPKFSKWFLTVLFTWSFLLTAYFWTKSTTQPFSFNTGSENFDYSSEDFQKKFGGLILPAVLVMIITGVIQTYKKKDSRSASLFFILSFSLSIIIPAYLNIKSRTGGLDRAIFVQSFCILGITGFFILFTSYLNYTTDPSSFMTKIVAISAAFLFVIMEFVSYETLQDHNLNFQNQAIQEVKLHSLGLYSNRVQKFIEDPGTEEKALVQIDELGNPIYQVLIPGYRAELPYLEYRKALHKVSLPIVVTILIAIFLILTSFPLFFHQSLIKPLENLLSGVGEVNNGNLDTNIEPRVEDEIGFLTKSFNQMVYRIKLAQEKLKEYANELEAKVEERTKDLKATLNKVQQLKNQQDGDYFLTSLLLKPLNMNKANSESVTIEFFASQKKKFQFKGWQEEIGGDLCMANTILLKGRKYTVFMNADAMGKSLQGAGGALVLGSVFESILNRNKLSNNAQDHFPERWIKYTFLELHQVFETFDGSMLASMVLGLIDDETGLLYSINVEHPWSVLLRDGNASFIDTNKSYRKLGTLGVEGNIQIFTLQLEDGDTIILGSDGRDDLLLEETQEERVINEDETLILKHVEVSGGDLEKIYERINSVGEPIDDVTLVRIAYKVPISNEISAEVEEVLSEAKKIMAKGSLEEAKAFLESQLQDKFSAKIAKLLFQLHLQTRDYAKASNLVEPLIRIVPSDTDLLYYSAFAEKKMNNYRKAIDLGERVKLRLPDHFKNLINLADSYFFSGNKDRAMYLLEQAHKLNPDSRLLHSRMEVYGKETQTEIA